MNKAELVEAMATETGATKAEATRMVDAMVKVVTGALKKGNKVSLVGFGTFKTSKRAAHKGRNPQTGAVVSIPARTAVGFKAGSALKESVN
jgi:DNA-binding protein HU-beta